MIKIRCKFSKEGQMKFIGHLDLMRLFHRGFRRADIPVKYSEGFNPQPKLALATALPLGVTSQGEYFDLEVERKIPIDDFLKKMNSILPDGIKLLKAEYTDDSKSIMSLIRWSSYIIQIKFNEDVSRDNLNKCIEDLLGRSEIMMDKVSKKKGKIRRREVNIREYINELLVFDLNDRVAVLKTMVKTGSTGNLKPEDLVSALSKYTNLDIDKENIMIQRLELFIEEDKKIISPI